MFHSNSPFGYDNSSYSGSIQSNGYSIMDDISSQASRLSRPSAKSIYMQRKEYSASINKMMDKFQYKVEHLFTCDLDGKDLRNIVDCVERLKLLDQMGRVWGQNMLLEVSGTNLLLTDIETREELESICLSDIHELKAVLDHGVLNSLLIVSVQPQRKHTTTVFMFQCEDVRADYVEKDLYRALSHRKEVSGISRAGHDRVRAEPVMQWTAPDYGEEDFPESDLFPDEVIPSPLPSATDEDDLPPLRPYTELDRNVDILNHIIGDIEIFMGQVSAAEAKNIKKKKKKKVKSMKGMPLAEEFATCLHKIKCGFNLVGALNGQINNPSAADFVHSFFSILAFVVSHCHEGLPQTIVAPLMTPECIRLLSEEATPEEDQLWQSLGDAWNIPSTRWPEDDEDIPTYNLEFFDGWQPPEVTATPATSEPVRRQVNPLPVSRQESPQLVRRQESPQLVSRQESPQFVSRQESLHPVPSQTSSKWRPPQHSHSQHLGESQPRHMFVKCDFISRNHRELTIRKGEVVQLLDTSKQWWRVRNNRGEEGFVPNNVLQPEDEQTNEEIIVSPVLTRKSRPAEVKAWLEYKDFSKITVRCLGGLSGSMLLGMTREELKTVCPEEGGRVFFQLQAVKSTLALQDTC
ncbi:epidermal growth factor receptor kinase substrate 8-like protein 3 isoform X2 [Parambassis ranga]|uniref:Epidermal growth factor receptor kinase substrate 8-like protein 3 isoform X2 n=1 Tax=Parambassis ranga TaxID=210632 RepID=A0A6P7IDS2_9TELE|nr:epidermal growth factor receptor kinase substrate 8-like protein 3 isoform X2 [Parambassis ranga]